MDSQLVERALVITPVLAHLYKQIQKNVSPEELLDLCASGCTYLFEAGAPLPEHYRAVRRALDDNKTIDSRSAFSFFPSFGNDRGRVGQFLAGDFKNLLAHKLGGKRPL